MMRFVMSQLVTGKSSRQSRPSAPKARLEVEALEDRLVLSTAAPLAPLSAAGATAAFQQMAARNSALGGFLYSGTTLAQPLSATAGSVWFKDITGLPSQGSFFIRVDQEEMLVKGGSFIGGVDGAVGWMAQVTRGANDTTPVGHVRGIQVDVLDKSTTLPYPSPRTPSGNTPDLRPTFVFSRIDGADSYDIWVNDRTTGTTQVLRYPQVPPQAASLSFMQWQADRNLIAGHQYEWRVRAISRYHGAGQWSPFATFTVGAAAAPGAPNAPTWTPAGGNAVRLTWNNVAGNTGYVIEVQIGSTWARVQATVTNVTNLVVNNGYGWSYRVRAANGTLFSPTTFVPLAAPNTPSWVSAGGTSITLSWNKVNGATDYVVQYWTGSVWKDLGKSGNKTSYKVNNAYGWYYRVGATNGTLTSFGNYVFVPALSPPAAPRNFKAVHRYGNNIELQWDTAAGATNYVVEYWNGTKWVQLGAKLAPKETIKSITNGNGWWWRVGAVNGGGTTYTDPLYVSAGS